MLNAWCSKVSADLCVRKGFSGVAPFWILRDLSSPLARPLLRKEIRHCFVVFWLVEFGTGFYCRGFGVNQFLFTSVEY